MPVEKEPKNIRALTTIIALIALGSASLISRGCSSQDSPLTEAPTSTPALTAIFNQELLVTPFNQEQDCIEIYGLNPPGAQGDGLAPTAWSAWEELGRPSELYFFNNAGPDADPNNQMELNLSNLPSNLPKVVHNGDEFCLRKK